MHARPNPFHHLLAIVILMTGAALLATSSTAGSVGPRHANSHRSTVHSAPTRRAPAYSGPRDARGHIVRSESARERFMRETGYPHGRPGYVVDHVIPLAKGGADDPSNMQWQTIAGAKAKDKWERK